MNRWTNYAFSFSDRKAIETFVNFSSKLEQNIINLSLAYGH